MSGGKAAGALAGLWLAASCTAAAWAQPFEAAGLRFSDELGGITILDVWGSGTPEDPITVVEEMTDPRGGVLTIRGLTAAFPNLIRTGHQSGFVLRKEVRNLTGREWLTFEIELRHEPGTPSDYGDGLSFGQEPGGDRPFASDLLGEHTKQFEPQDRVAFGGGRVAPGETVWFEVMITHSWALGRDVFVLQEPDPRLARLTPPGPRRRFAAADAPRAAGRGS